jgi:hypothetical protein
LILQNRWNNPTSLKVLAISSLPVNTLRSGGSVLSRKIVRRILCIRVIYSCRIPGISADIFQETARHKKFALKRISCFPDPNDSFGACFTPHRAGASETQKEKVAGFSIWESSFF